MNTITTQKSDSVSITILVFDYSLAAAVMGINDLLFFAGGVYAKRKGQKQDNEVLENRFQVRIASDNGEPVRVMNQLSITPHCSIDDIAHSDVYLVPTIAGDVELALENNGYIVDVLQKAAANGSLIGSNSNGSFFLAEAGLLAGKKATTFWNNVDLFRSRYPEVDLQPDQLLVHDGNVLCDAGGTSWFDLGLYLVELFCDHQTAMDAAKHFMVDLERSTQLSFSPLSSKKHHGDPVILEVQRWMENHYAERITMESVGDQFGLSNRSLVRRFKLATGVTPLNYLQEVRLDVASKLLVQSNRSVDDITHAIGYEDISSFIRLFKRRTNYSPSNYRARFRAVHVAR